MTILGYECRGCDERFMYDSDDDRVLRDVLDHIHDRHNDECTFDVVTDKPKR